MRRLCPLFTIAALALYALPAAAQAPSPARVLFIGNSYTYTNGLPAVVRKVAAAQGVALTVQSLTAPGVAIEDHFDSGALPGALRDNWDLVVLQQGPSSLVDNRRHLAYWTRRVREAAPSRTRIVMFSVWPAVENVHTWHAAELSYAKAALRVGGCVFPAAGAWRIAMEGGIRLPLYSSDNLHPTREGTLLAALSMVHALWGGAAPAPISNLASQFPEREWQAAMAISADLDRHARQAVHESLAPCTAGEGT
jgi:hypothetical protein